MKTGYIFIALFFLSVLCKAQGAESYFNTSANHYVQARSEQAKQTLAEGIRKYPNDPKLKALAEKLKEEEKDKKDQENKDQQNQDQKKEQEQQQKDQEQKENEKKEKEKEQQQKEQKENKEKKEEQKFDPEKMQQMKLSEEKARMILEAMRNQEKQYLQQNKRKATKPKDKGKPDW